uniref:Uncharacterized protein n=1 Tax=Dunaliella tertiolecta TaxID=3047 RepID=A0A7S3QLS7_DUNTE
MLKSSVADPGASPLNPPAKVISDDGTRRAEAPLQEALKPSLSVLTRPASALKPRSSSTAPYLLGSAFPAGASKRTGLSLDAPRSSVPNSSGSSPHTPSSPSMQEPQVQPSPPSSNNFGLGGPIRIQSSRSMRLKTKAGDEGCSKSADLAQQQSSPKAGAAGLALESARRRSALQASTAPLKATPHYQLTEPKVLSLSMSEPPSVSRKPSNVPIDQATEHPMVQPRTVSSSGASAEAPALASRLQLSKPHRGNVPEVGAARQPSKLGSRSSADEKAKPQPPPPQTSKQRSSSEPRQRSKLRKNSSTEPGGAPAANSARVGTKHVPARGKSILNIKAALGSAMASVLNPVMQTQRK